MTVQARSSFDSTRKLLFADNPSGVRRFAFGLFLRTLETCAATMPAVIVVMTLYFITHEEPSVLLITAICLGTFVIRSALLVWSNRQFYDFAYDFGANTRKAIVRGLFKGSLGAVESHGQDGVVSLMSESATNAEGFASDRAADLVATLIGIAIIILGTVYFDWRLTLVLIFVLGTSTILLRRTQRMAKQMSAERKERTGETAIALGEFIGGMAVLRMFGAVDDAKKSFEKKVVALHDMWLRYEKTLTPMGLFAGAIIDLAPIAAVILAAVLFERGAITADVAIGFSVFALAIGVPLKRAIIQFATVEFFFDYFANLDKFITSTLPLKISGASPAQTNAKNAVSFENVSFTYPEDGDSDRGPALQDVSLSIPKGSLTAIVGPSGSGKSTVLKLMMRHWDANDGDIFLDGKPIKNMSVEDIGAHVSAVFQEVYLFRDTVRANLKIANANATDADMRKATNDAQATKFIEAMPEGLGAAVGEGGLSLSGGERQRLSIARAALKTTPLMLLDEPTASIDGASAKLIMEALASKNTEKTVVIVSHALFTIKHADNIIVMKNGRIEETGKHEALLNANGLYARLWAAEQNAKDWKVA